MLLKTEILSPSAQNDSLGAALFFHSAFPCAERAASLAS